ncbi:MAG: hypothetical protein K2I11_05875, partial [Bacteroides sp.]|nr:hypothetical protein [Bacteroides sp.]
MGLLLMVVFDYIGAGKHSTTKLLLLVLCAVFVVFGIYLHTGAFVAEELSQYICPISNDNFSLFLHVFFLFILFYIYGGAKSRNYSYTRRILMNMETVYFLIILLAVVVIYAYFNIISGKQEFVQCVEAGPTLAINAKRLKELSFYDRHRTIQKSDGQEIDTSGMIRIVVKGNCMRPKNIESGAQLLVKKINEKESICNQIKKGDILL